MSENLLPSPKEPMAVAREFVRDEFTAPDHAFSLRSWRGGSWTWRTSHYAGLDERALRAKAYRYTEDATYIDVDKDGYETVKPWAPNRYKIADLCDAVAAVTHLDEHTHPPAWLEDADAPPADELVAVKNGLLHVPTRELYRHDPAYFNLVAVPFDYDPNAPQPERWLTFLDELWPDDRQAIAALQEFLGYVISGHTEQHKIMLIVGPLRSGKGTIARILKALVGEGNHAGPTLASLGTNFGLQPLVGKPLAIISDARLGGGNTHQVVERLLSISGEDMLTIDRKYMDAWTGTLPTRFLIISNELPRFGDASGAIASRFVMLTLERSWLGRENTHLTGELLSELPGILNWALDGLDRLQTRGHFIEPASSRDAVVALADLVSPVAAFVRDRCHRTGEVPADELYAAWKLWAEENGHRLSSTQTFGRDLRAVIPGLRMVRPRDGETRQRRYQGLSLTKTHNARSQGPLRTESVVLDGPRDQPLSPVVEEPPPLTEDDPYDADEPRAGDAADDWTSPYKAAIADDPRRFTR